MKKKSMKFAIVLLIFLVSLISLYPFYTMVMMSTYKTEDIFKGVPLLPSDFFMTNLKLVMQSNFIQTYANSLFVSIISTSGCVFVSAMAGYGLTIYKFRFRKVLLKFVMMTMMVPTQIGIIGFMIEMKSFHMTGTIWPLIIGWFASGFGAYWMTQFIQGALPREIVECARIDGCNEFGIFLKISIPCMIPGLTTLALLIFLWSWNSYLVPLVFVNKPQLYTIPIFIKSLGNAYRTDYGAQITGLLLSTIPLVLMFVFGSKSFIKGLTAGAVKG
ncbi:MAG: carbohydrate ABC transporter permease [Lachnospiraceae bacterium]|nr:carbohydrate ABC transporter permease [Lachnospiraceae bacterium]